MPTNLATDPAEWLRDQYQYENCAECGGDESVHDAIPLMGNWFARCRLAFLQCGHPIEPVQMGAARRCMVPLNRHDGLDHEYVSLGVPCLHCPMAIYWRDGAWRDSHGDTGHHARYYRDFHDARIALAHEPDPAYVA